MIADPMHRAWRVLLRTACLICFMATASRAEEASTAPARFQEARAALERGAPSEAIDELELLADQGFVHPDASFNRGLAYARRASTTSARPGDWGNAAAGMKEALLLRPKDTVAEQALQAIRDHIARQRAREKGAEVSEHQSLSRALVGLLTETTWVGLAVIASLILTAGLLLRLRRNAPGFALAGAILVGVGGVSLLLAGAGAAAARHFRLNSEPAVVVVERARLLDEQGRARSKEPSSIFEGQDVQVLEMKGGLARVQWGSTTGWVNRSHVRVLTRP